MAKQVIAPSNLGAEFDLGVAEANKIRLKLNPNTLIRNASNQIEVQDGARVVTATGTLLASDKIVFVQNGATAITLTIPTSLIDVVITRSLSSTGTITIQYAGGTIEALAGTMDATTSLAAVASYGGGARYRQNPNNSAQMLRVRL